MSDIGIFIDELKKWNQKINLVSRKSISDDFIASLIQDSLQLSPFLTSTGKILDIGTGNGFPILPCKITSKDLDIICVERNRKKASFLNHVISKLKLNKILIITEDISRISLDSQIDCVTSKAFKSIDETIRIVEDNSRIALDKHVQFLFLKGPNYKNELDGLDYQTREKYKKVDIHTYSKGVGNIGYLVKIQKCST